MTDNRDRRAHDGPCRNRTGGVWSNCACPTCRARRAQARRDARAEAGSSRGARLRAVVEDYLELRSRGLTRDEIAPRVGYPDRRGLDAAIRRAYAAGLLEREQPVTTVEA